MKDLVEPKSEMETVERPGETGIDALLRDGREKMALFDPEGYEEAVALLREAITERPDCAAAYAGLAEAYSFWGFRREINGEESRSFYDLSLEYAEMALALAPESASAHRAMSVAVRCGPHADAERRREETQIALDLGPDDPDNWVEGWRAGGYSLGGGAVGKILALRPPHLGALIDLGAVQCERGLLDDAVETLRRAIRIHPRNTLAYYDLAMALDRKGERSQALGILRKVAQLRPEDPLIEHAIESFGGSP